MKILEQFPPNYEEIRKSLGDVEKSRPIFAFGETLYNPFKIAITPDIEAHEEAHMKRQGRMPEIWWQKYLFDKEFRLEEEVIGYGTQYAFLKRMPHMNSKLLEWFREKMGQALSGPLYKLDISYGEAMSKIRNHAKNNI